jgi:hypothetical protein
MFKYIIIGLKKTCLGSFRIEKKRDKDNATVLKGGRRNRNVNYSAFPYTRCAPISLFAFVNYLPFTIFFFCVNGINLFVDAIKKINRFFWIPCLTFFIFACHHFSLRGQNSIGMRFRTQNGHGFRRKLMLPRCKTVRVDYFFWTNFS